MSVRILLFVFFAVFNLSSCRSGLSDYAKSMSQCRKIQNSYIEYEKSFNTNPHGIILKEYIVKNDSEFTIEGWKFGSKENQYLAYKTNVQTDSGDLFTIIIFKDGSIEELNSEL